MHVFLVASFMDIRKFRLPKRLRTADGTDVFLDLLRESITSFKGILFDSLY